jgi:hypothetical protein
MLRCDWIEGSRAFNIAFGTTTSLLCLAVAVPILWWVLPKHRVWLFSPELDGDQRIQLAYGVFCMSMAFTDALCRYIPHQPLPWVHPAFFFTTVLIVAGIGPRVAYLIYTRRRGAPQRGGLLPGGSAP